MLSGTAMTHVEAIDGEIHSNAAVEIGGQHPLDQQPAEAVARGGVTPGRPFGPTMLS